MKKYQCPSRGRSMVLGALLLSGVALVPMEAKAVDWLDSIQDQRCDPEDIAGISAQVRNAIEASVRRAEMSIQAPTPVGDLSCLNDLMTIPLDVFSGIGGLLNDLTSGLSNLSPANLNIDIDVSGMVCAFAAAKFAELTKPLTELDKTIAGYASLASNPADRLNNMANAAFRDTVGGIWDDSNRPGASNSTRISSGIGYSGVIRTNDSSGYSGSINNYVLPSTTASPSDIRTPIYDDPLLSQESDDAWQDYNQRMMRSLGSYIGCRVARSLDGTRVSGSYYSDGVWDTPGSEMSCVYAPGAWPVTSYNNQRSMGAATARVSAPVAIPEVDRTGGQERVTTMAPAAVPAADAEQSSPASTIWNQIAK